MWHHDPLTRRIPPHDPLWDTLWQSPQFRQCLADPNDPYRAIVAWARSRPWWHVHHTHPREKHHFGAWFGQALGQRTYANPLIHDLYVFHEILHAATFHDDARSTERDWRHRMRANEIAVSLETEVLVYARHPEWRALTFDHPIWADRFDLSPGPKRPGSAAVAPRQAVEQQLWQQRHAGGAWPLPFVPTQSFASAADLWRRRRQAALHPTDEAETAIARYEGQSDAFFSAWRGQWRHIEHERAHFERLCRQGHWEAAMARREQQWERHADADGVPYGNAAVAFG